MRPSSLLLVGLIGMAGCTAPASVGVEPDGSGGGGGPDGAVAGLRTCTGRAFTAPAATGFQHTASRVMAETGARHRAQDVIVPPGTTTELVAKLTYGPTWKDLQDEQIKVYLDDCARWVDLGSVFTDSDGLARVELDVALAPGQHELRFVALGDATQARASLWVLPVGTHVVVSDIDGTLTTADTELFKEIYDGDYVPQAYPSSTELTAAHAARGHLVVYLSGRPSWLIDQTRAWLGGLGFTAGPLHLADSNTQILPMDSSVGAYKVAYLEQLEAAGYVIDLAYGNATTDIFAYTQAGIPPALQWIIGPHAGEGGTTGVTGSWAARTAEVAAGPRVAQPF